MSEPKIVGGSLPSSSALDNPAILSKLINRNAIEQLAGVINENLSNFDEDDSGIFCYLPDESLKDSWYRLLRIRASYVPQYQIEVYLKSFYIALPSSFKHVLDYIFEEGFLEGDVVDTYEKMKTIFGHPMNEKVESTSLLLSYQNESIKEIKASLDTNFYNVLNLSSTINSHMLYQNRRINSIDSKFALFFPKTKDGNT